MPGSRGSAGHRGLRDQLTDVLVEVVVEGDQDVAGVDAAAVSQLPGAEGAGHGGRTTSDAVSGCAGIGCGPGCQVRWQ